jgi:RNA polymerase primary sigma factor
MSGTRDRESLDSLNLYFQKVKTITVLSAEEERELIIRAKNGDEEAFKKIIVANQKLVVKEALKYYFKGENFLDLINEGNKGLIEALKRFDTNRDNRFYTYAIWWVRSEIRRYLSKNQNIISFPDIFYNDYLNFKKVYFNLTRKLKRKPTENELSETLGIPVKKVKVMLSVPDEIISLDKNIMDGRETHLSNYLPDESVVDPQDELLGVSLNNLIREDIEDLTPKEASVVKMRYGFGEEDPMKLREIAKKMDMSPEGVRRIEMKALAKLKKKLLVQGVYGVLN